MPSFVSRAFLWVRRNLSEIAATFVILTAIASFVAELDPIIWQGALVLLAIIVAYEVGYRRGEGSLLPESIVDSDSSGIISDWVESDAGLVARAAGDIEGWFVVREGGDIVLQPYEELNPDRKGMLYTFAARAAYDAGERDTPHVNQQELIDEVGLTGGSSVVFLSKMGEFIERHYDRDRLNYGSDGLDSEDVEAELNISQVSEAVKYIQGERPAPN